MDVMKKMNGTPKTLRDAIEKIMLVPMVKMKYESYEIIKDYLAQRFQVALLNAKRQDEKDRLMELWREIFNENT